MDIIHTAIWVSDLDEAKEFFIDGLGLEHTWDFVGPDGATNFYVRGDGDADAEIQLKHDPDSDRPTGAAGIDHIAVTVDDTDAEFERLVEEVGCGVVAEPSTADAANARIAFVEGPDGYVVELVQPLG